MTVEVAASAVVDPAAELAPGVTVGPFAVIGAGVRIGEGSEVGAGAHIQGPTRLGKRNRIFSHACIGFEPQDLKYRGEEVHLEVGDGNVFREFTTVHRGTAAGLGRTVIGDHNLFMAYVHVAHDCVVGDRTIFANGATLAGHVEVGDCAVVGAFSAVQQFRRVGSHCYVGGFSVITMDALPYMKVVGQKPVNYGVNRIGLERRGFDRESIGRIEAAMRLLLRSGLSVVDAVDRIKAEVPAAPEVDYLVRFVESAEHGFIRALPGRRRSSRGGGAG